MRILLLAGCACLIAGCSVFGGGATQNNAALPATATVGSASSSGGSWWWPFGGGANEADAEGGPQLGVNAYLWRASLDTLNFMPLGSADPVGGIINTEWYSAPENPNERTKVTVYILDKRLRADALKVAVFRQARTTEGWIDAAVNPDTPVRLENAILTRARELHLSLVQ